MLLVDMRISFHVEFLTHFFLAPETEVDEMVANLGDIIVKLSCLVSTN